jgi:hypothetical protein
MGAFIPVGVQTLPSLMKVTSSGAYLKKLLPASQYLFVHLDVLKKKHRIGNAVIYSDLIFDFFLLNLLFHLKNSKGVLIGLQILHRFFLASQD